MKAWRWVVFPPLFVIVVMFGLPSMYDWWQDTFNPPPGHWKAIAMQATSLDEAVKYFSKAIQQDSDDHESYWRRGMSLAALSRLDEAIADVTTATRMAAKCEYLQNLGDLYSTKGDARQAINLYSKALQVSPANLAILKLRGNLMLGQGRYDEAASDFTAAISLDPHSAELFHSRAAAFSKANKAEEALADQRQAERLTTH